MVAALVAFTVSAIGAYQLYDRAGEPVSVPDAGYVAIMTFVLQAPVVPGEPTPVLLTIGRVLAPLTIATAAVRAFSAQVLALVDEGRARAMSGHTVIVGLGPAAAAFARRLVGGGGRVAVLEVDPANALIDEVRMSGVPVVIGDGGVKSDLRLVRTHRATRLVSFVDATTKGAVVASTVAAMRKAGALTDDFRCFIELDDPWALADMRRAQELSFERHDLDYFSLAERAAHAAVDAVADALWAERRSRVVVSGSTSSVVHILQQLVREQLVRALTREGALELRVELLVGSDAERAAAERLLTSTDTTVAVSVCSDRSLADDVEQALGGDRVHAVIVADADPVRRARVYLALSRQPGVKAAQTAILTTGPASLESLLDFPATETPRVISLPDDVCTEHGIARGRVDDIARAIHERYLLSLQQQAQRNHQERTYVQRWSDLPEKGRTANIQAAIGLLKFLDAEGYLVVPRRDTSAAIPSLAESTVERIAALEHQRWRETKTVATASWEEASDDDRRITFAQVRSTPELLAFAGYELEPTATVIDEIVTHRQ